VSGGHGDLLIGEDLYRHGGGWRPGARWAREDGASGSSAQVRLPAQRQPQPLVTIHRSGQRVTIAAACPAAQELGLVPGMALTQARALVPGIEVEDADLQGDAALLERLALFAARRWTPRAAVAGTDGLWLDLSGVAHLFGGEQAMAARIVHFCDRLGLSARIAIAGTAGAAHALARHGGDSGEEMLICAPGGEEQALARLPIAALRVEDEVVSAARRLGSEMIGELIAMPRGPLGRRFGAPLLTRLDQALGRAAEAVEPIVPEAPPSAAARFAEPIATAEAIAAALGSLIVALVATLEKKGLAARRLMLRCARVDGEEQRIAIGTARATRDGAHLLALLGARIETIEPGFGIDAMKLVAERCEPLGPVTIESALAGEAPAPDLAPLIDRLAGRLGAHRLFRMSAVESDVPERSLCAVPPLGEAGSQQPPQWPKQWPRPVRLLAHPEPVDKVVALLPDGAPRRFTWRGDTHVVRQADGPERIYGEWWRSRSEAQAVRDYFQVEDECGARFWIFRRGDGVDRRTGDLSWYVHGVFG
jgi:protein ImuB